VRLSLIDPARPLDADVTQALATARSTRQPVLTDLHAGSADQPPHLDVIAPICSPTGAAPEPLGAVVLQIDAQHFLYPLIQSWPTPSRTAETLLVRRDGEDVLFLSDLRHQKAAALTLRIPLSRTDVPAVQAVLGRQGMLQGHDYRGVEVLSVLRAVPDSPWFVIAKMDTAEVFALWRFLSVLILALLVLLAAGAVALVALVWQRNEKAHYQSMAQAEADLREASEQIKTLRGIVPICMNCKKIRDDQGFWNQVEVYVRDHTEAEFSHGLCPLCLKQLYPEFQPDTAGSTPR
jgi:two-component system, cell cycle sensor histidine kinase and response regulator CckA